MEFSTRMKSFITKLNNSQIEIMRRSSRLPTIDGAKTVGKLNNNLYLKLIKIWTCGVACFNAMLLGAAWPCWAVNI